MRLISRLGVVVVLLLLPASHRYIGATRTIAKSRCTGFCFVFNVPASTSIRQWSRLGVGMCFVFRFRCLGVLPFVSYFSLQVSIVHFRTSVSQNSN